MRLSKAKYNYIIEELKNYDNTINKIDEIKRDLAIDLSPEPNDGQPRGFGQTSDVTGNKAVKLITLTEKNAMLEQMTRLISKIDCALIQLDDEHRIVFKMTYRDKKTVLNICNDLHMSLETYYRRRRSIIYEVAKQLGFCY